MSGLPNFGDLLKKARTMQEQMQRDLEGLRVEASAGGGMVTVHMNGQKQILNLKIDPQLSKDADLEMIQELVKSAVNQATREVDEQMRKKLGGLAGGLGLPNLPGLF
jgi:DNA-binding YbaB/EbfC family protein